MSAHSITLKPLEAREGDHYNWTLWLLNELDLEIQGIVGSGANFCRVNAQTIPALPLPSLTRDLAIEVVDSGSQGFVTWKCTISGVHDVFWPYTWTWIIHWHGSSA